ncbi:MAG: hypothetical protein ACK5L5_03190 [Bacteroidales bacterium]
MEMESIYTFAAQSGGGVKVKKFFDLYYTFKKSVENNFKTEYSTDIKQLSIIFRVDGKFAAWEEKGINRMRLMKSKNYITIDIGITEDVLELPESEIWKFVWSEFKKATNAMLDKLQKSKIDFNFSDFKNDFDSFMESETKQVNR